MNQNSMLSTEMAEENPRLMSAPRSPGSFTYHNLETMQDFMESQLSTGRFSHNARSFQNKASHRLKMNQYRTGGHNTPSENPIHLVDHLRKKNVTNGGAKSPEASSIAEQRFSSQFSIKINKGSSIPKKAFKVKSDLDAGSKNNCYARSSRLYQQARNK